MPEEQLPVIPTVEPRKKSGIVDCSFMSSHAAIRVIHCGSSSVQILPRKRAVKNIVAVIPVMTATITGCSSTVAQMVFQWPMLAPVAKAVRMPINDLTNGERWRFFRLRFDILYLIAIASINHRNVAILHDFARTCYTASNSAHGHRIKLTIDYYDVACRSEG